MVSLKVPSKQEIVHTVKHRKASVFFYGLVVVLGWFAPPLAVLVRFGAGKDFFLNIILTLCGYFPGHAHNFYLQNIRNNTNKARTPKWAIRYGLVHVEDKRKKPKHQWANRYDERLPTNDYDTPTSSPSASSTWDGRGPEPPPKDQLPVPSKGLQRLSPWKDVIQADEVADGYDYSTGSSSARNRRGTSRGNGEWDEEFYQTDGRQDGNVASSAHHHGGGGKIRNLMTGTNTKEEDRFERMERARRQASGSARAGGQGDWERQEGIEYFGEGGGSGSGSGSGARQIDAGYGEYDNDPYAIGGSGSGGARRGGETDSLEHRF